MFGLLTYFAYYLSLKGILWFMIKCDARGYACFCTISPSEGTLFWWKGKIFHLFATTVFNCSVQGVLALILLFIYYKWHAAFIFMFVRSKIVPVINQWLDFISGLSVIDLLRLLCPQVWGYLSQVFISLRVFKVSVYPKGPSCVVADLPPRV